MQTMLDLVRNYHIYPTLVNHEKGLSKTKKMLRCDSCYSV